jgi:PKHD-type hydroxylase
MSAALPHKVFPPLINCYREGGNFDFHIDNALRQPKGSPERVRTDLSSTLFLSDPDSYDGGAGDPGHLRRAAGQAGRR